MKTKILNIVFLSILILANLSCDGEDGKDGVNGEPGTVNVIYSDWINQDWNAGNEPTYKIMRINESRLTTEFTNKGGIALGFFRYFTDQSENLPLLSANNYNVRTIKTFTTANSGDVEFSITSTDGTTLTSSEVNGPPLSGNPQYKYVLIPGGVKINARMADFKNMTYIEVCKHFNIPE
jgi:hypothetical protein